MEVVFQKISRAGRCRGEVEESCECMELAVEIEEEIKWWSTLRLFEFLSLVIRQRN